MLLMLRTSGQRSLGELWAGSTRKCKMQIEVLPVAELEADAGMG